MLIACVLPAGVAGFGDVRSIEFGVGDVVKDIEGLSAKSSSTLLLDFVEGAGFCGPVHEEFADGPDRSAASAPSCSGHV